VEFHNPGGKQSGISHIEVDGNKLDGNLLPPFMDGVVHKVKVIL
jgi:hypothetical protein